MIELIDTSYRNAGSVKTVTMLDELKRIGYQYATEAGFSISMDDMVIPEEKSACSCRLRIKSMKSIHSIRMG